jgi:hypothetical protein
MAQQIQIVKKPQTSKSTAAARQDNAALDLRTPSGKKLPY